MNATRAYTVRYGGRQTLWSVGRVQTPLLAMIVGRDDEIRQFKPERFWELFTTYRDTTFKYTGKRFTEEAKGRHLLEAVTDKPLRILGVEEKKESRNSPLLYDLTDLQRDMNRRYGMSAADTLKVAQKLYEAKIISYPRTDSRFLSGDMRRQIPRTLGKLADYMPEETAKLDLQKLPFSGRIINDKRVTDHHAIIPTGASPRSLAGREKLVFDAILTRLLAVFYPPCIKSITKVNAVVEKVPFQARGVRLLQAGWTELYPRKPGKNDETAEQQELPQFTEGECGPHNPYLKDGITKPPRPYSENTLLAAMETAGRDIDDEELREAMKERGLGTPATRAAMIETLLTRNYIERNAKTLKATTLGRYLIAIINNPSLTSAELTGGWEAALKQVEQGRETANTFMTKIATFADDAVRGPGTGIHGTSFEYGPCPCCGKAVIKGKRGYGCSDWKSGCRFVLWAAHEGYQFNDTEIRQLLHNRVLSSPIVIPGYPEPVGVAMNQGGEIILMPKSIADNKAGKRGTTPSRRKSPGRRSTDSTSKRTQSGESLGDCPICGSAVNETTKAFGCSAWKSGCKFVIWRKVAGKNITASMVTTLLTKSETKLLKGFKSRAGKPFSARLKLIDNEVKLNFDK